MLAVDDQFVRTNEQADLTEDYAIFQALRPYIGHCLTLNHDINNPLAGILGYAEFLLADESLTPQQQKHLKMIYTCAERIKKLVEELCEKKMALAERVDLKALTDAYKRVGK